MVELSALTRPEVHMIKRPTPLATGASYYSYEETS
jgi:hypothetical protein